MAALKNGIAYAINLMWCQMWHQPQYGFCTTIGPHSNKARCWCAKCGLRYTIEIGKAK